MGGDRSSSKGCLQGVEQINIKCLRQRNKSSRIGTTLDFYFLSYKISHFDWAGTHRRAFTNENSRYAKSDKIYKGLAATQ
ncbi:unnamed protein product [Ixodes pacificus]